MGATLQEAEELVDLLRSRFPYLCSIEEDWEKGGFYIALISEFGVEKDLKAVLSKDWHFSGWENREQRSWMARIERIR